MKRFLRIHYELVLMVIAGILLVILLASFMWGAGILGTSLNRAINVKSGDDSGNRFNLEGARSLNLKGSGQ